MPAEMRAAVYRGRGQVRVEQIPVPEIGPGELLVRVEACGICHTDLKKIAGGLLPPPRIYGHETAGVVVASRGAAGFREGDRVAVFHHIPCRECFYCRQRLYAQCETYRRVGVTAGFAPAGGGFAQYVRVMDWIARRGVVPIPDGVGFDRACFIEPVNTCLKAVVKCGIQAGETVAVFGQGPIGLLLTQLAARRGAAVYAVDPLAGRRAKALRFGAAAALEPGSPALPEAIKAATEGRGADAVIVAADSQQAVHGAFAVSRPGARILLFAQTAPGERIEVEGAAVCVGERVMLGCYSADVDLQDESARLVLDGELPVEDLISHRLPLDQIQTGIEMATHPDGSTLKILVYPQR